VAAAICGATTADGVFTPRQPAAPNAMASPAIRTTEPVFNRILLNPEEPSRPAEHPPRGSIFSIDMPTAVAGVFVNPVQLAPARKACRLATDTSVKVRAIANIGIYSGSNSIRMKGLDYHALARSRRPHDGLVC
jgi:hypothetical protein